MLLLALLACTADDTSDSGLSTAGTCFAGPTVTITSPEAGAKVTAGEPVSLVMEAHSETDDTTLRLLWAVMPNGGDTDNLGVHATETWTPSVDDVGLWTVFAQAEDECTDDTSVDIDPVQDTVRVEVVVPAGG